MQKIHFFKVPFICMHLFLQMILSSLCMAQEVTDKGGDCGRSIDILYNFVRPFNLQRPDDIPLQKQFDKLGELDGVILEELSRNYSSMNIIPIAAEMEKSDVLKRQQKYIIYGWVRYNASDKYELHLFLKSTCSEKILAETDVFFQLYPSWDPSAITKEAVTKLMSKINLKEYELKERAAKNYGLGGDLWGGRVKISILNKALHKGGETEVLFEVQDCDGEYLKNKPISTEGTTGGILTPAKFTTNSQGVGKARFKMTSDKEAVLKASSEIKNVMGCQDLYTGAEVIGSVNHGYKVTVKYYKTETESLKMDALVGKADNERIANVNFRFSLYYSPALPPKDGEQIIITPEFENTPGVPKKGNTIVLENRGFSFHLITDKSRALIPNTTNSPGQQLQKYESDSPLPPQVSFMFKNNELVYFSGGVNFPEVEDEENYFHGVDSHFGIEKDNKKYFPLKPKKVTESNSPYKWLYEFEYKERSGISKGRSRGNLEVEKATVQIWKTF